jgi:hypothetical protein
MENDQNSGTHPEAEALWFYGLNHGMAELRKRYAPLEPMTGAHCGFVNENYRCLGPKAVRAFYYLLLICTRESRHVHQTGTLAAKGAKQEGACAFIKSISGAGSASAYKRFLEAPPDCTIGQYVNLLRQVFYHGNFASGYGGPAWGQVCDSLCRFVSGEFTAEMMLDNVWTLAHNNGPVFNKGMLYTVYTPTLQRILDVQASGQVPEMVLTDQAVQQFVAPGLQRMMLDLKDTLPGVIGKYVDWYAVELLGAKSAYPGEKAQQAALHGVPVGVTEKQAAAQAKLAAEAEKLKQALAKAQAEKLATQFVVMPGLWVPKIKRKLAA